MKDKKVTKKLLAVLLLLLCIAIIIVAFIGVYVPTLNKISNIIPDFKYGTEIDGMMEYRLSPDESEEEKEVYVDDKGNFKGEVVEEEEETDESTTVETTGDAIEEEHTHENNTGFQIENRVIKANEDSVLTSSNFNKSKEIMNERLKKAGATEYSIRVNEQSGEIVAELSQNDNEDFLYEVALSGQGKFDIIDSQTGVVLLDGRHLEKAGAGSNFDQSTNSYTVYLQLQLTEEGGKIFREMSKKYVEYTDENGESKKDYIAIRVDGSTIMSTYFQEEYKERIINIPVGQNITDEKELKNYGDSVSAIANKLNMDEMPVKYTLDSQLFIKSSLDKDIFKTTLKIVLVIYLVVMTLILIVKYKLKGLLAGILNAGYIGLVIVVLKYLEITITFSSLLSFLGLIIINGVFLKMYLNNLKEKVEKPFFSSLKSFYSIMAPIVVIAFIFTFFANATVTGIGFVLFWGILIELLFNLIITQCVLMV